SAGKQQRPQRMPVGERADQPARPRSDNGPELPQPPHRRPGRREGEITNDDQPAAPARDSLAGAAGWCESNSHPHFRLPFTVRHLVGAGIEPVSAIFCLHLTLRTRRLTWFAETYREESLATFQGGSVGACLYLR